MHGTSQQIGISSSPSGAKVTIDNNTPLGVTPIFANLSRGDNHVVTIEMEGYSPVVMTVTRSVSGWVWGNIVIGGLIGLAVDAASGGLYSLSPEQLSPEMKSFGRQQAAVEQPNEFGQQQAIPLGPIKRYNPGLSNNNNSSEKEKWY